MSNEDKWLVGALDYIPRWIELQMQWTDQPGCAVAVAKDGTTLLEAAFGHADLPAGKTLTPRHRFRVASHSKTFTAAGILKLREQGALQLDDPVGRYVNDLHPEVAAARIGQLLSHSAGLVRDGADSGQWTDRRPFLDVAELRADLAGGPVLPASSRFKYSNHGYGLLGLAIEAVAGEPYRAWITREIVAASGLEETMPDVPLPPGTPLARGHSAKLPLAQRVAVPGENDTRALAAATGFVSTASDLARFYASLTPGASRSVLSVESRREMTRRHWRDPYAAVERWYGLGTMSGSLAGCDWFGHTGGFQGHITRTAAVPSMGGLAVSVLTNAADGASHAWLDGILHILRALQTRGAPSPHSAAWRGRWWSLWGALDLLPAGDRVLVANPLLANPLQDASEIEPHAQGPDRDGTLHGRIVLAGGYASHGEPARLEFGAGAGGRPTAFGLGGGRFLPRAEIEAELGAKYGAEDGSEHVGNAHQQHGLTGSHQSGQDSAA
jgi:D-alanyl-D-alanine carboxypeptidase